MAKEYISVRNLKFMLHEVFDIAKINALSKFQDYDAEAYDMAIEAAKDISDNYLFPSYREMDKKKAYYDEKSGVVKVHPALQKGIKALANGGWLCPYASYEEGGQQMPTLLMNTARLIMHAANANIAHLMQLARSEKPEVFLADATLFLEFFGIITVAWLWLKQGIAAQEVLDKGATGNDFNFYQGKLLTMQYYFEYELPKIKGLQERLMSDNTLTVNIESAYLV